MRLFWAILIGLSVLTAALRGQTGEVMPAVIGSLWTGARVIVSLIGVMCLWLGVMKIAEASGLTRFFARMLRPLVHFLFPELRGNTPAQAAITMNISANALGLGNAATPFGVQAMKELQAVNPRPKTATDAMCTFLAINTAGVQLIPTGVVAVLVSFGSDNPTEIIVPCLIVTALAQVVGVSTAKLLQRRRRK
ncbi:MAG: nucleoside recognition domain-containing protein [Alphaproteobacteria bacterium]|nr:nucleoside recognition domain-containing protein [Alphaproteobacteria bacterium]